MEKLQYFCDSCGKECLRQDGMGQLGGVIIRMNIEMKKENYVFGQHFCSECTETLLNFVLELKNAKNPNSPSVAK